MEFKRILLLLALLPLLFAQSNISKGLAQLEETTGSFMLMTIIIQFVISLPFIVGAVIVFLKKLKGAEKKEPLWILVTAILALIGLFFLAGAVLGLIVYLTAPVMMKGLLP